MKNKNYLYFIIPTVIITVSLITLFILFKKNHYSLTVADNNYLSKIKDNVIDINYVSDYPVYSDENGLIEDFLNYIEKATGLTINKLSVTKEASDLIPGYAIKINNQTLDPKLELLINEDPYVILSKDTSKVNNILSLNGSVGLLNRDFEDVSYYLSDNTSLSFSTYNNVNELLTKLENNQVKYIIIPNIMYLDKFENKGYIRTIVSSDKINKIVFQLSNDKKNKELNKIFTKVFNSWKEENFIDLYNKSLFNNYLNIHGILDKQKADFLAKVYTYGYIQNSPYEVSKKTNLVGIAGEYIDRFKRFSGVEIEYKAYKNIADLTKAINSGEVDIFFNTYNLKPNNFNKVPSTFNEQFVVLARKGSNEVVTNLASLKDKKVNILKDHALTSHMQNESKAKLITKDTIKKLTNDSNLIITDSEVYNYYKDKYFKKYDVVLRTSASVDYNFMVASKHNLLTNLLTFTVNSNSYDKYKNKALRSLNSFNIELKTFKDAAIVVVFIILIPIISLIVIYYTFKKTNEIKKIDKENRHKYTDVLTGLKNRNYLNLNIKYWNKTSKYPQSVILLDLNNINYVNDNYGYEAGDKLIKAAASVLISTQLENSEIIRTDGNEFMIYLIGYTEKQTEIYVKKLKKEMKKLPYKFGAGIGYSMIFDEIKTLDDAINEALMAVKVDKEDEE